MVTTHENSFLAFNTTSEHSISMDSRMFLLYHQVQTCYYCWSNLKKDGERNGYSLVMVWSRSDTSWFGYYLIACNEMAVINHNWVKSTTNISWAIALKYCPYFEIWLYERTWLQENTRKHYLPGYIHSHKDNTRLTNEYNQSAKERHSSLNHPLDGILINEIPLVWYGSRVMFF